MPDGQLSRTPDIERAARAIHAVSELAFRPWRFILPEAQERFRAYAKAALDA